MTMTAETIYVAVTYRPPGRPTLGIPDGLTGALQGSRTREMPVIAPRCDNHQALSRQ
jgi:hypothetical protein